VGQGRLDDLVIGTSRRPGLPDRPGRPHARPATPARPRPRTRRTAPASAMPPAETAASASSPDWPACVTAAPSPAPGSSWERQDLQLTRGSPGRRGAGSAPCAGLTPTSTAAAIPSGTLLIASGNPATRSARSYRRSGRTERSHRPAAAKGGRIMFNSRVPFRLALHRTAAASGASSPTCRSHWRDRSAPRPRPAVSAPPIRQGLPLPAGLLMISGYGPPELTHVG
jgi:hypothetical protein